MRLNKPESIVTRLKMGFNKVVFMVVVNKVVFMVYSGGYGGELSYSELKNLQFSRFLLQKF